jgi:glycosyltransferase involved in cell wall biosynthesis
MKTLQIGPYPPPYGGVESNLVAIHHFLLKNKISSIVINVTRFRDSRSENVYYPKNWFKLLWLLIRLDYDIVHIHIGGQVTLRLLALSFVCCIIPGKKSVLTFHSGGYPSSEEGKNAGSKTLRGFIFRKFDAVICVNKEIVKLFSKFGLKPEKIKLICPYSYPQKSPNQSLPEQVSNFFECHTPVLITVGGLEKEYGLTIQIDVLESILKNKPNCGLVIIGSGSLEDELKNYINSKPYRDNILLYGDMPHSETLLATQKSDIFLRTSLYDGDSIAVREALHLGKPTIATDTTMRPDGVLIIPVDDKQALLEAIEISLSEQSKNVQSVKANTENLEAVLELYKKLINR